MVEEHPFRRPAVRAAIERLVAEQQGAPWRVLEMTDLADRSSHPAAILRGDGFSVFAKALTGPHARRQAQAELSGLALIRKRSSAPTAMPIGTGSIHLDGSSVVVFATLTETTPEQRKPSDWQAIGRTLAAIHRARAERFGLDSDGFFGPLPQDNRPVPSNTWTEFYAERRVRPWLRTALDAGRVSVDDARRIDRILSRLHVLAGAEPVPTLLHGDAQHHNLVSTSEGAVVIDASPYYGHPEIDLALVDYFVPVPPELFGAYAEVEPIDSGFAERRELWRIFAYLGVLTTSGDDPWGRSFRQRLTEAVKRYS